jgi:PiT family inorganic phosphate transporter
MGYLKFPVSTTQLQGSDYWVGVTRVRFRWGVTVNLLWAWILTIPVSAVLAFGFIIIC